MRQLLLGLSALLLLPSCASTASRIAENSATFEALDPVVQNKIRAGQVEPGFTSDLVYLALGRPASKTTDAQGNAVWIYRRPPMAASNESVSGGFVRRQVYDPVRRVNDVVIEPVDEKAFPHLVERVVRITFQGDRVAGIEQRKGR